MGRLRGCLWLTAGLVVALLAGFVGFMTLSRASGATSGQTASAPEVTVVVAARAVPVRSALKPEDVEIRSVPVNAAPEGALRDAADAIGKLTLVDLYPGEMLLAQRLVAPNVAAAGGRTALVMAGDQVLMALPAADLMSQAGVLKPGDHVELLFSLAFPAMSGAPGAPAGAGYVARDQKGMTTFDALQNVAVSALVTGGVAQAANGKVAAQQAQMPVEGILLAVSSQDALVLKYAKDNGGVMDVVLRAPGVEQPLTAEPVDAGYLINRYRIPVQTVAAGQ
jgi:pilus assembly protein CpaB